MDIKTLEIWQLDARMQINSIRIDGKETLKQLLDELVLETLKAEPDYKLTKIEVTAYTPFFNDGDECTYRVYHYIEFFGDEGFVDELYDKNFYFTKSLTPLSDLLLSNDTYEQVLGDVRYVWTPEKSYIENYTDHE